METYPKPKRKDYEEFLVRVVYRPYTDYLAACIDGAYLDICRTMHGFSRLPEKESIRSQAKKKMKRRFKALLSTAVQNQEAFDDWHRNLNIEVAKIFCNASFRVFAGQMQKWINMSFKNIYVCGEGRVSGFKKLYSFCHMPIDNIVLRQLRSRGLKPPNKVWSRWDYNEYIDFHKEIRKWFGYQPLLNVEHKLWIDGIQKRDTQQPQIA